jgi:hypothetical protein
VSDSSKNSSEVSTFPTMALEEEEKPVSSFHIQDLTGLNILHLTGTKKDGDKTPDSVNITALNPFTVPEKEMNESITS